MCALRFNIEMFAQLFQGIRGAFAIETGHAQGIKKADILADLCGNAGPIGRFADQGEIEIYSVADDNVIADHLQIASG